MLLMSKLQILLFNKPNRGMVFTGNPLSLVLTNQGY